MDTEINLEENFQKHFKSFDVDRKIQRFPPKFGVPQKVTLISNTTGIFKQISFVSGLENTVNGSIADDLLDMYPDKFRVIKVNGVPYIKDSNTLKEQIAKDVLAQLKENFDIVPKKTENKRDRLDEAKLTAAKEESPYSKDNLIPDEAVSEEKITKKKYTKVE